jgi:hypothetical protein
MMSLRSIWRVAGMHCGQMDVRKLPLRYPEIVYFDSPRS